MEQKDMPEKIPLCLTNGKLNPESIRWDSYPFVHAELYKHWGRKKQWMYWAVVSPKGVFATVIANVDYMKIGSVYFAKFNPSQAIEKTKIQFTKKNIYIPPSPYENAQFTHSSMQLEYKTFSNTTVLKAQTKIEGKPFTAEIEMARDISFPTLNVVIPWSATRFQFTSKQLPFPAKGKIQWGNEVFDFDEKETFACLDYGSGKWKYKTDWNWAAGYGQDKKGRKIAINLGGLWTDGTGQNENGLWIENHFYKIHEEVKFIWNRNNPLDTWSIKTKTSDNINLTFRPFHIRPDSTNLIILKSKVVQCFGNFYGTMKIEEESISIDSSLGWAEEHHALW